MKVQSPENSTSTKHPCPLYTMDIRAKNEKRNKIQRLTRTGTVLAKLREESGTDAVFKIPAAPLSPETGQPKGARQ